MSEVAVWALLVLALGGTVVGLRAANGPATRPPGRLRSAGRRVRERWCGNAASRSLVDGLERVGVISRPARVEPVPAVLLVLELRRLADEVRRVRDDDALPHQAARLFAALAAYDHVLCQLCERTDLQYPIGLLPLDRRDRLLLEADLARSGVDW